ncbi:DNA repair protein RadA, partial [Candidatus Peregrinibacteria bacterium]|nr:DNA repair protein RadA [Candidatus Peregrinibacteria bacterium]
MKITTIYACKNCSYQSPKWIGRCPECEAWNSFAEETVQKESLTKKKIRAHARSPESFECVTARMTGKTQRYAIGMEEVDRVLGGGFVEGSLILLTGEPGIGKSTLTLQIADGLSSSGKKVLYFSGEESEEQIALRGKRLGLELKNLSLLCENKLETMLATVEEQKPNFFIVDSIQLVQSETVIGGAGSVSQVRLCTEAILEFAKARKLSVLIIGHVTKDGTLAGPRVLEHLVDVVLYLEGSRTHDLRILRGVKNRFGSVSEIGIFEMKENGLQKVAQPASLFVQHRGGVPPPGTALVMTVEGSRSLLIEVQALCNRTVFGYP